jgi:malate dehydrogenase
MVLGGHGDSMVPVPEYSTVNGIPITQLLTTDKINEINVRTQNGGAEIVALLKTGSAYYAPSASAVAMVEAVLLDSNRILPVCAFVKNAYGIQNLYCGVPAKLNRQGVGNIIELKLSETSLQALQKSAHDVQALVERLSALAV